MARGGPLVEASGDAFVLALAGMSPAVVTELLWHLVTIERRRVIGLEVWTTASFGGTAGYNALFARFGWFEELRAHLGPAGALLPEFPAEPKVLAPPRGGWDGTPFRVVVPQREDGTYLEDITTQGDAEVYGAALYDRVRELRTGTPLPPQCQLIGALAGGRKTMSAALQTAFTLQARAPARLVHVWVHSLIERDPDLLKQYAFPREVVKGVPVAKQVSVYDVPFLPMHGSGALAEVPDQLKYSDVTEVLKQASLGSPSVRVCRKGGVPMVVLENGGVFTLEREIAERLYEAIRQVVRAPPNSLTTKRLVRHGDQSQGSLRKMINRAIQKVCDSPDTEVLRQFFPKFEGNRWVIQRRTDLVIDDP